MRNNTEDLKTIHRAVSALLCINNGATNFSDISATTNLPRSTTSRLLSALENVGLIGRDPVSKHYYLGKLIAQFASNFQKTHQVLLQSSMGELKHLSKISEETVRIDVAAGIERFCLHEISSKLPLRVALEDETVDAPLHAGATGKVLLSQFDDKTLKTMLNHLDLIAFTLNTITNKEKLLENLQIVRQQGYAVTTSERYVGVTAISVPIHNYLIPASLTIRGPESRLQGNVTLLLKEIQKSARWISHSLSGQSM